MTRDNPNPSQKTGTSNASGGFKKRKLLFLLIPLVLAVFLGIWYFSETDQDRLAHAYEYDNSLLCYLISNDQTRLKCSAVLTGDIKPCNSLIDEYEQYLCYYGVVLKTEDARILDNLSFLNKTCYDNALMYSNQPHHNELEKNLTKISESCNRDLLFVKDICYEHLAWKTRNVALCNEIVIDEYKFECIMRLTENISLCLPYKDVDYIYDLCVASLNKNVSYCDALVGVNAVDLCFYEFADVYVDSNYCKMMKDRNLHNNCFISVKELPGELQRF